MFSSREKMLSLNILHHSFRRRNERCLTILRNTEHLLHSLCQASLISKPFLRASLLTSSVRPGQLVVGFHIYSYMTAGCQQITGLSCDFAGGGWVFVANYPDNTWTAGILPTHDMSSSHVFESWRDGVPICHSMISVGNYTVISLPISKQTLTDTDSGRRLRSKDTVPTAS